MAGACQAITNARKRTNDVKVVGPAGLITMRPVQQKMIERQAAKMPSDETPGMRDAVVPTLAFRLGSMAAWRSFLFVFLTCMGCAQVQTIDVRSDNLGPPLVGFGADMNPYLYCQPNWGNVTEANAKDLEAKVIALRPKHVRIFLQLNWFDEHPNDEISRTDPRVRESCIRTIRLAQRAGATVNLTLWFGFWKTPEASMKRFAEILAMLVNEEHLDAIRYVTVGNEVNAHEGKISIQTYNRAYLALDRELKRVGLREHIKIISGDLVAENQERWFANLASNLSSVSDGYSVHMYWDYWDTAKLLRRVSEVPKIVAALPTDQQRPLYITEFG